MKTFPVSSLAQRLRQSSSNAGKRQPLLSLPSIKRTSRHSSVMSSLLLLKKSTEREENVCELSSTVKWTTADLHTQKGRERHTHTRTKTRGTVETVKQAALARQSGRTMTITSRPSAAPLGLTIGWRHGQRWAGHFVHPFTSRSKRGQVGAVPGLR